MKAGLRLTREIADFYGFESRINQMEEEMGELIQAFCKYRRVKNGEPCRKTQEEVLGNIAEELADVFITMDEVIQTLSDEMMLDFLCKISEKAETAYKKFKEKTEMKANE